MLLLSAGCQSLWPSRHHDSHSMAVAHGEQAAAISVGALAEELPTSVADAQVRSESHATLANHQTPVDPTQMAAVDTFLAEVRSTTALDSTAEAQLRKELLAARRDEWPIVLQQFRSTLKFRQELLAREAQQSALKPPRPLAFPQPPAGFSAAGQPAVDPNSLTTASQQLEQMRAELVQDQQVQHVQLASHHTVANIPPQSSAPTASNLPVRGTTVANHTQALASDLDPTSVQPASHVVAQDAAALGWEEHLSEAITAMQQQVKPLPGSTDELQEHMRLRMLLLTAGREEASLEPIPGASASEQDYWAKQLFAISALLDCERQPDMKQRAAGALIHLDQARARLGELASLQVRNLTFADSVDGFGLYEPHVETKFHPGDQVTLYTEVENFRSESTKNGYRTSLATSYEVVDPQGRRVDGAQFPEVEDLCQNLRHDFHMQYGLALPTRIYPGTYELRLTITDQLSNKIGHSSIPFEIVD